MQNAIPYPHHDNKDAMRRLRSIIRNEPLATAIVLSCTAALLIDLAT